ncbi:mitochondrial mRNA pseudouridine synthase TRUB2 isoform X2 [Python bivittatus]|uniref:Mitochondrial mRNA pseudouridine synthase TRUB2 isoform X2 n=1 Tax=Python bivittatus TaxID=176946 RepID=A0A9F3QSD4_PYTBI|nr:mitochondrial mRNA pseudouridine synthase TRUB2 isoform X2 [Python bivittatus]
MPEKRRWYRSGGEGEKSWSSLLLGLNSLKCPQPRQQIRFQRTVSEEDGKDLTLTVNKVPMLVDHPLVSGPIFTHLKVGAGHRLDTHSSGVFLLGVGHGTKMLTDWYNAHLTRTYTVNGVFGKATDDFSDRGKLIEKTTFDHITQEKLERIISVIQGSHHKALLQPPPSLSFLPRRFYGQRKEPDSSQPLCFSKSPANPRVWTTGHSMGSHKQQPLWKALLITLSLALFLLWCALRSETDMDRRAAEFLQWDTPDQELPPLFSREEKKP